MSYSSGWNLRSGRPVGLVNSFQWPAALYFSRAVPASQTPTLHHLPPAHRSTSTSLPRPRMR